MEFDRFDSLLLKGAESLAVQLDREQLELLYRYFLELTRWSKKINLISKSASGEEIVEKHFIDSLALLSLLDKANEGLLDIGSGAGFPGLVCKAVKPELRVGLVEPRLKRVSFLRHIIRLLELTGIKVHGCRLEDGVEIEGESTFCWVVSRAVAEVGEFLKICDRFKNYGSSVVCMKGPGYLDELNEKWETANGWRLKTTQRYRLPFSDGQRCLLVFEGVQAFDNK